MLLTLSLTFGLSAASFMDTTIDWNFTKQRFVRIDMLLMTFPVDQTA